MWLSITATKICNNLSFSKLGEMNNFNKHSYGQILSLSIVFIEFISVISKDIIQQSDILCNTANVYQNLLPFYETMINPFLNSITSANLLKGEELKAQCEILVSPYCFSSIESLLLYLSIYLTITNKDEYETYANYYIVHLIRF